MEIVFSVSQENDGGYVAECLTRDVFSQGNTWEELRVNVREAFPLISLTGPSPPQYVCIWSGMSFWPAHEAPA